MFSPVKMVPPATRAAPTGKPEYGAYARCIAARAASTARSTVASSIATMLAAGDLGGIGGIRQPRDQDLRDATALHVLGDDPQVPELRGLAGVRDLAEQIEHEPADRVPLLVGEIDVEQLVEVIDGGLA